MNREQQRALQALQGRAGVELLRRALAPLRAAQRGRDLPPEPTVADRALYASTTPTERGRVSAILRGAGFTRAEVERGERHLQVDTLAAKAADNDGAPADDVTRRRARQLRRGRA